MPRFLIPIIILSAISWSLWFYILFSISPNTTLNIAFFLFTFLAALGFSFSVTFFLIHKKFAASFTDLRLLFRKDFRRAILLSFSIVGIATLKLLSGLTTWNAVLFCAFLILLEIYLSSR